MQPYSYPVGRVRTILTAIRIPSCMLMGFAVILGEAIGSQIIPAKAAVCGFWTGFFLLGACMVLDFDRGITVSNTQNGILPVDVVRPNEALSCGIVLASFGLLSAAYLGAWALLTAALCVVVIIVYHTWLKKHDLVGEVFVGIFMALIFIFAGFAVGRLAWPLTIFAIMAFLAS
ncbi:MAG TPA: UbiA family prenyltransferase, partial [Terriglobales bacterium]|nr:UbiA family prenyltransferase [Terriglobales bacterium]